MAALRRCPRCGNPVPPDVAHGICPACLLGAGLEPASEEPPGEEVTFGFKPSHRGHVLESLARSIGSIPRVLLPDTANDDVGVPVIKPSSDEMPAPVERGDRYQLFGEIARGGMGAVLKGRDPDLGRDLAVKVLLESHKEKPELVRRFVEEAQIGGQLQHPGIVPDYELGTFADRRPYFTMKLVKGRTLATLLAEREPPVGRGSPDPAPAATEGLRLPRFLSIFEAVCQTVAYAHARGVIHRDLKPSNVMVGSFGEVQVMDWGLAKVLKEGGVADEPSAEPEPEATVIATVRSGSNVDHSRPGSVMGTPAYMAPEQAAGEVERVDRRADVFGLGSILCEILTGHPAYTGKNQPELIRKAMRGETANALMRLDGCGAEAELVSLAKDCLAVEPEDRPRDAGVVAGRITAYLTGVQARVQAAERERAVAVARAVEERRRRKLQLGLAASVLALTTLGGLSTTYYLQQRQARAAAVDRILGQALTLRDQAAAQPEEVARWQVALAAAEQADAGGDPHARDRLLALHTEIQTGLSLAQRDRALLDRLVDIRSAKADDPDGSGTDAAYADAFGEAGLNLAVLPPAEAGVKIKTRPSAVALGLAAALDDWSSVRRSVRKDAAGAKRLSESAQAVDPDPWRNDLRAALDQPDKETRLASLRSLAKRARPDDLGAVSLDLLGSALNEAGDAAIAETVLRGAQRRHPGDVWVNYDLAGVLEKLARRDDAIRYYIAARSIRSETAHKLAHALADKGESDEAIAVFQDLVRLRPEDGLHLGCLGAALQERGRSGEADKVLDAGIAALRAAIRIKPGDAEAHNHLGNNLRRMGKHDEGIAAYRQAIRLKPDYAVAYANLGNALGNQGKHDEGIAACRQAILLKPDLPQAHFILGAIRSRQGKLEEAIAEFGAAIRLQPDFASAHFLLGSTLKAQGKPDEAIAEFRAAIRLKPDYPVAHNNLGIALVGQGKVDDAIVEYRTTIRLKPDFAGAQINLGGALLSQGKLDEAIAACREAIRLKPDLAEAHNGLGTTLGQQGKHDEAVTEYRTAIRLKPDYAEAHCNLGGALQKQGDYAEALEMYRKGHELGSRRADWRYPSAQWVAQAERILAVANRFPAVLRGGAKLNNNADRLVFAQMAFDRKYFAAAARMWGEALEKEPQLANDRKSQHPYNAACAAALAAAGQGKDEPRPDDAAKAKLRQQALDWLN